VRKLSVLSAVFVLALAAPATAREPSGPVVAPEFANTFPPLLPVQETARAEPATSGALGPDERVLLAATFWLLLAGLALWRVAGRPEHDPTPIVGWVLGYAPPLPR
jgi:hypothetical protein